MSKLYILVAVVLIIVGVFAIFKGKGGSEETRAKYQYRRKQFFMNRAEHEFYDKLVQAVGNEYYIFAQVHFPTVLDHTIKGQVWRAALAHINRKSVDFVLCDKAYISPKLAIELDGSSHEREDRKERDEEVERILEEAKMPLLRLKNNNGLTTDELRERIKKEVR